MNTNGFVEAVAEIRNGATLIDLEASLVELVRAVRETGRGGSLVYTLAIKPAAGGRNAGDAFVVSDEVRLRAPELERGSTVFFASRDGLLQRESPRQPQLAGLKVAADAVGELRSPVADRAVLVSEGEGARG